MDRSRKERFQFLDWLVAPVNLRFVWSMAPTLSRCRDARPTLATANGCWGWPQGHATAASDDATNPAKEAGRAKSSEGSLKRSAAASRWGWGCSVGVFAVSEAAW